MKSIIIDALKHVGKNTLAALVFIMACYIIKGTFKTYQENQNKIHTDIMNVNNRIDTLGSVIKKGFGILGGQINRVENKVDKNTQKINVIKKTQSKNSQWQLEIIDEIYRKKIDSNEESWNFLDLRPLYLTSTMDTFKIILE
jgi:hypothetical protein